MLNEYAALSIHSTDREIGAAGAERDSIKMMQVKYWSRHEGEESVGTITGVTEFGFFVAEALGTLRLLAPLVTDLFHFVQIRARRLVDPRVIVILRLVGLHERHYTVRSLADLRHKKEDSQYDSHAEFQI